MLLHCPSSKKPTMPKLTLTYFDFDGGRGEPARLALSIAGIDFEDRRVRPDSWPGLKSQMPYGALPMLEVDGRQLTQSNAINRYVGKLANLYPTVPLAGGALR
jgi:prostaglandin-H2 D-isomerase / glutathione transferase